MKLNSGKFNDKNSTEFLNTLYTALTNVWQAIGPDLLVDNNGNPDYSKTFSVEEGIDILLDSSFLESYGKPNKHTKQDYDSFTSTFRSLPYPEQRSLAIQALPPSYFFSY